MPACGFFVPVQVQLGDVRPPPPDAPSSLLPVADIRQHWQQQQQLQQQDDTAAAADGAGDMAVPSLAAVPSWLSSGPGLHAVREALQPGTPLEWYREGVWLPVVVLHCSLAYSRQPDALQALLREGFEAARDPQAAATAEPQLEPSMQLPGWQPLTANTRVATVLLLTGGEQVGVGVCVRALQRFSVCLQHVCLSDPCNG